MMFVYMICLNFSLQTIWNKKKKKKREKNNNKKQVKVLLVRINCLQNPKSLPKFLQFFGYLSFAGAVHHEGQNVIFIAF